MIASGDRIDRRYELLEVVGRGGAAEVWRARDERLSRIVAIKMFRPGATDVPEREHAEVEVMARLAHPALVTMHDGGTHVEADGPARTFVVMEFVNGVTLRQLLREGPLGPRAAARIGSALASGLAHMHAHGIVHRDVKPANILLHGETVKLADFGVARILDGARVTEVGTTVGTANYLSPEQVRGLDITPASDIYSLGLVVIEMITGEIVYPGSGVPAALARLHRPAALPALGPAWTALLAAMVSDDPQARPSADQVTLQLGVLTRSAFTPGPAAVPIEPPPELPTASVPVGSAPVAASAFERRRPRVSWLLTAAAVGVCSAVLGGLLSGGSPDPSAAGPVPALIAGRPHTAPTDPPTAAPRQVQVAEVRAASPTHLAKAKHKAGAASRPKSVRSHHKATRTTHARKHRSSARRHRHHHRH